jgi:hypothetical protein
MPLQHEHGEQQDEAGQVEGQQCQGIALPALLLVRVDPGDAIAEPFYRLQRHAEPGSLTFHHLVIEASKPGCRYQHQRQEGRHEGEIVTVHELASTGAQERDEQIHE